MVKRERYLRRLRPFYDSPLVKVITGIRRCGKSVLLDQIADEIVELHKIPDTHIIKINFEDYRFRSLYEPETFYSHVESLLGGDDRYYLFFDEIQNVREFEVVVNSFRATHNVSIFITGSNSKLLSGELATHLGGRTVAFKMLPFSFGEFCEFQADSGKTLSPAQLFDEYRTWGGFPLVCAAAGDEEKQTVLSSLYDSVVLKDIILRNKIASPQTLDRLLDYVIANSANTLSGNNIASALNDGNRTVSAPTVYDYIRFMQEACLIDSVRRYDIRGKKVLSFEEKAYACDFGFFTLKKNCVKDEFSLLVETAVYNELISRGFSVHIGKTFKGEVDFIAQNHQGKCYIQATYLMETAATREREFGAFSAIHDNYPKYVISLDPLTENRDGIRHLNLTDFLLDEALLVTG